MDEKKSTQIRKNVMFELIICSLKVGREMSSASAEIPNVVVLISSSFEDGIGVNRKGMMNIDSIKVEKKTNKFHM